MEMKQNHTFFQGTYSNDIIYISGKNTKIFQ